MEHSLAGPTRPLGSPEIPQFHLPGAADSPGIYAPAVYGAASVHFVDRRRKIDETRRVAFKVPLALGTRILEWDSAASLDVMPEALAKEAPLEAPYLPLPSGAMELKIFTRWAKTFDRWIARTQRLPLAARAEGEPEILAPKRGGVSVELVAILWELT